MLHRPRPAVRALGGSRWGGAFAGQFYAGWLTEYSLSLDNLFVFVIIMTRFRVPPANQQTVLLVGVVLALVLRGIFITAGSVAISRFSWVFYLFGAFLVWTAIGLARHDGDAPGKSARKDNPLLRLVDRVTPTTPDYDGLHLRTRIDGRQMFTPMLIVMVAIGTTDVLFALDSIPAIFGLTKQPYLVFTANAFALMGLMQLYFLLGGLLDRLVFLGRGLAVFPVMVSITYKPSFLRRLVLPLYVLGMGVVRYLQEGNAGRVASRACRHSARPGRSRPMVKPSPRPVDQLSSGSRPNSFPATSR